LLPVAAERPEWLRASRDQSLASIPANRARHELTITPARVPRIRCTTRSLLPHARSFCAVRSQISRNNLTLHSYSKLRVFGKGARCDYEIGDRLADICESRRVACLRATSYPVCCDSFSEVCGRSVTLIVQMKYCYLKYPVICIDGPQDDMI